jgi:integrase/recombinase XerD
MSTADKDIIERFCDAIWLQEGLSANTLEAYRRDLEGLSRWLAPRGTALTTASRGDLLEYLSGCVGKGASPRTTARLLSSLRRFYGYLVREERIKTDPTVLIDSPKIGRPLPKSLSECRDALRPARPCDAGDALRHRPARVGTGRVDAVAGQPHAGRGPRHRQG